METSRRVEARFEASRGGSTEWVVTGATLEERLSSAYRYTLDVASSEPIADAAVLLGSSCVLTLGRRATVLRACGIVTSVREGTNPNFHTYARLIVEPALAALRYRSDTRIFQAMSVPQILAQVLGEDLAPFERRVELRLAGSYPAREYTVQYDETDYDFVYRLMEEEGIGHCFEHEGERERLVLFDRPAHLVPIESEEGSTLRYVARSDEELDASEGIHRFERIVEVRPNKIVTRHFDWTHPSAPMIESTQTPDSAWPSLESYVHDAPLTFHAFDHTYGAANSGAQNRLYVERARRDAQVCDGDGSALGIRPGFRFDLIEHPRNDLDGAWAITRAEHRFGSHADAHDGNARGYACRFGVIPVDVPWRPELVRRRPKIVGVQTATVVGPAGEEIHCDPHGRVKVQFHWDRLGARDDKSSCWIRVMQAMGGAGWGFSFIPRIGMEVVVTFIEGDPDRPLITGVVYNAENPPPYDYPADKTRTTIKSNSSPGGGGWNELRFEDKAGQEEIWLHGEKDWNTLIKHDHNRTVGNCESQQVVIDRSRKVGNDESIAIGHDRTRRVGNDETVSVGNDRKKSVASNETLSVGKNQSETIGQNLSQTIGMNAVQTVALNSSVTIGKSSTKNVVVDESIKVGGDGSRKIGKNLSEKVGANLKQKVGQNLALTVGMARAVTVTLADQLTVGGARNETVGLISAEQVGIDKSIVAGNSISFVCGDSSIKLEKDGTITIKGKKVIIEGEDHVDVDGKVIDLN